MKAIQAYRFALDLTKTTWNGGRLVVADRWYPSSKTCSGCGTVKAKLALHGRTYACQACDLVIDRDRHAALNLAAFAAATTGSGPAAARGADQKTCVRRQVAVNPARRQSVRPGPSHRKAGLSIVCSPRHTER